jgi:hypothetical protein
MNEKQNRNGHRSEVSKLITSAVRRRRRRYVNLLRTSTSDCETSVATPGYLCVNACVDVGATSKAKR